MPIVGNARLWALAAVAVMAVTLAQAALQVTASSLSSSDPGSATLDDAVVYWYTNGLAANSAQFTLEAERIRQETDSAPYVYAGLTFVGTTEPTTSIRDFRASRWTGVNWYSETSVFLVPTGSTNTTLEARQGIEIPDVACISQPTFIPGAREALCPDASNRFDVAAEASRMVVAGSFDVFLWGWQGAISYDGSSEDYWTGTRFSSPQAPGASTGPAEARFIKLSVANGTASFDLATAPQIHLFSTRGVLNLDSLQLLGSSIVSAESTVTTIRRSGDQLAVILEDGTVTDAAGNTRAVSPIQAGRAWDWTVTLLVIPAVLAILLVRDGPRHVRYAADNLFIGNPAAAYRHARAAMRYPWSRRRATVLAVIALLKSSKFSDAEAAIKAGRTMDAASRDFLTAFLEASRGRTSAAGIALARSIAANPSYRTEAHNHRILRGLLEDAAEGVS